MTYLTQPVGEFSLGDRLVRFRSSDAVSAALVREWLPGWRPPTEQPEQVLVDIATCPSVPGHHGGTPVVDLPGLRYWRSNQALTIVAEGAVGRLPVDVDRIDVWWVPGSSAAAHAALNRCLRPLMALALARHGLHPLHAASVSIDGSALALLGSSGVGKSTLAGRMADLGAAFMSDDTSFLATGPPRLVGLRDYNRPRTAPDGDDGTEAPRLRILRRSDNRLAPLRRVLALQRGPQATATVRPMPPEELMAWLVRSGTFGLDPRTDQERLVVLSRFASAVPALLVTLGDEHPGADTIRDWMGAGSYE